MVPFLASYVGAGNLNLGLRVGMASALLSEPSPQASFLTLGKSLAHLLTSGTYYLVSELAAFVRLNYLGTS